MELRNYQMSFYSKLVRLKVTEYLFHYRGKEWFLFQIGSIKSLYVDGLMIQF